MIVVTVEKRSAVTGESKVIGRAIIVNHGTGTEKRGNYDIYIGRRGGTWDDTFYNPQRIGQVEDFPANPTSVWRLIIRALRAAFPEEK